jgi:hypothetical protein
MVFLGDVDQVEACFSLFGDSINLEARYVHGLRQMYHKLWSRIGHTMVLLGDVGQVEARFRLFGDSINLNTRYVHGLSGT